MLCKKVRIIDATNSEYPSHGYCPNCLCEKFKPGEPGSPYRNKEELEEDLSKIRKTEKEQNLVWVEPVEKDKIDEEQEGVKYDKR
jgi:hypothetical protein